MSLAFPDLPPNGRAVVIGIPQSFDLSSEIASANTIRLATAFAHPSGWDILAPAISTSKAKTFLLTGKNFFQTHPAVLRNWLKLSRSGRVEAKLHTEKIMFHPKVLVVEGQSEFAIIGSGNLSRGGLHGNVECAVFVGSGAMLGEIRSWFDDVFYSKAATRLDHWLISEYERHWKPYHKSAAALHKRQKKLDDDFVARTTARAAAAAATAAAVMKHWHDAVAAAKHYGSSPAFQHSYEGRVEGGRRIKRSLRYPAFDFDENGWKEFYSVKQLGNIPPFYRDRIFRQKDRLQEGMRKLVGSEDRVPEVLNEFLSPHGRFHVTGLRLNIISKILAVHAPLTWSVYNRPVADALRRFGYVPPRGASPVEKFITFTQMMEKFKLATGLRDAYALDVFMLDVNKHLKNRVG